MRDFRRRFAVLLCVAYACATLVPTVALAATPSKPTLTVPAATIVTVDGQVLWSHKPNTRRRVASTIKMLNVLVVRERASLDEVVTVTKKAAETEDGVGLVKGQKLTVRKLIQLTLVASSNDAAAALAIHVSGSEKKHVARMNAKAKQLGLKNTHADDPHGLSEDERSTARDLTVLARKVMTDPFLRKTVLMRSVTLVRPHRKAKKLKATDKLLGEYTGIEGVKTGFTSDAGYCFVGAAKRGDLELFGVVLGAKSNSGRFSQMRKLLDWGFKRYRMQRLVSTMTTMGAVQVSGGSTSTVTFHASRQVSRAVMKSGPGAISTIVMPKTVPAPINRGDQLGTVTVSQNGKVLVSVALLADSGVATATAVPSAPATLSARQPEPAANQGPEQDPTLWARLGGLSRQMLVALASTL